MDKTLREHNTLYTKQLETNLKAQFAGFLRYKASTYHDAGI